MFNWHLRHSEILVPGVGVALIILFYLPMLASAFAFHDTIYLLSPGAVGNSPVEICRQSPQGIFFVQVGRPGSAAVHCALWIISDSYWSLTVFRLLSLLLVLATTALLVASWKRSLDVPVKGAGLWTAGFFVALPKLPGIVYVVYGAFLYIALAGFMAVLSALALHKAIDSWSRREGVAWAWTVCAAILLIGALGTYPGWATLFLLAPLFLIIRQRNRFVLVTSTYVLFFAVSAFFAGAIADLTADLLNTGLFENVPPTFTPIDSAADLVDSVRNQFLDLLIGIFSLWFAPSPLAAFSIASLLCLLIGAVLLQRRRQQATVTYTHGSQTSRALRLMLVLSLGLAMCIPPLLSASPSFSQRQLVPIQIMIIGLAAFGVVHLRRGSLVGLSLISTALVTLGAIHVLDTYRQAIALNQSEMNFVRDLLSDVPDLRGKIVSIQPLRTRVPGAIDELGYSSLAYPQNAEWVIRQGIRDLNLPVRVLNCDSADCSELSHDLIGVRWLDGEGGFIRVESH